jgi:hypothetical protein
MNYVYAGYAVAFGGVALYAVRVALRGRALRRALGLSPGAPARGSGQPGPESMPGAASAHGASASAPPAPPAAVGAPPAMPGGVARSADSGGER